MKRLQLIVLLALVASAFQALFANAQTRVPDAEQFVGRPRGTPLQGAALDARTHELAAMLRCPVCQGLAIADSPSEMAVNMRTQVRELVARGFTSAQILDYFEHSYGQFVLLQPKFRGVTSFVWTLPLLVLLIGVAVVVVKLRRMETPL